MILRPCFILIFIKIFYFLTFLGDLESVCSLKDNLYLKDLYLTGNPCTDYNGYRQYVIAKLPQLKTLDSKEITISDRIKAQQKIAELERTIRKQQLKYQTFREAQKERISRVDTSNIPNEEFWQMTSENSPETRTEICSRQKKNERNSTDTCEDKPKKPISLFHKSGRPLNINQAKLKFLFKDDDPKQYVLEVEIYKYMDSNLIDVDLQPIYVKVNIKNKIFQFVFPEEIVVDKSIAQRSQITGHLVLKLPKANYKEPLGKKDIKNDKIEKNPEKERKEREYLEVEEKKDDMDFSKIVENSNKVKDMCSNSDIPPLEYA